jgi:hypothetical protein
MSGKWSRDLLALNVCVCERGIQWSLNRVERRNLVLRPFFGYCDMMTTTTMMMMMMDVSTNA